MNFFSKVFLFWSVFSCGYQSSTGKNYEKGGITTNKSEACGSISSHCSTVILSEEDYLFVSEDKLFIRPLSQTIDGPFFTSNGTVAVCECIFYVQETFESRSRSCNLTIVNCPKVRLDPRDVLHLSDGSLFVKSLNTRLDDSAYGLVNGSVLVCECLNQDQEADEFFTNTCNFSVREKASMSPNCSTQMLRPRDYHFQSNATLRIFAWNVTLNESFYSVTNDSVIVCAPDCRTDRWAVSRCLQILCAFLIVFVFELFASSGYCEYPLLTKCKIASFLYIASGLINLMHIIYMRVGYYTVFVVFYYELSFLAVVEFGMLPLVSSDLTVKVLEVIGAVEVSDEGVTMKKPARIAIVNCCLLIMPFVVAYSFRSQEFSLHSYANKVSTSDYYYYKQFKESVPLFYIYNVVFVFAAANDIIFLLHLFWNCRNNAVLLKVNYVMYLTFFKFVTLFWIVGHSILIKEELYKLLWPLYTVASFFLSACISWFVTRL